MTIKLHVEHEIIGGETVLEKFEGVESFMDPPMTNSIIVKYEDERDDDTLKCGNVVRGESQ
jgi:hypothetical protein